MTEVPIRTANDRSGVTPAKVPAERRPVHRAVLDEAMANYEIYVAPTPSEIEDQTQQGAAIRAGTGAGIQYSKGREFETLGTVLGVCYRSPLIMEDNTPAPDHDSQVYTPSARSGRQVPHAWLHWRRNPRRSRLAFCAAALQLDPVGAHLTTFDPGMIRVTYALLMAVWSYPMLLVLGSGTFRHQLRLRRAGCDFEWSMRRDDDGPLRPGPDG